MRWNEITETEEVINEINLIPDLDDVNTFGPRITGNEIKYCKKIGAIGPLTMLRSKKQHNTEIYYLMLDNKPVGRASVVDEENGFSRVSSIWFSPTVRGKGYGFAFYEYLLQHGVKIVSDENQTRFSQGLWKALARKYQVRALVNGELGKPLDNIDEFYGKENSSRLVASLSESTNESEKLDLPNIEVGDEILVGKFKNRKAKITGFTKDDHKQPVLKTTKGDQKLFKPRFPKLDD